MSRLLIVDDDGTVRRTLAQWLRLQGHEVLFAGEGKEALEVVATFGADLIISDVDMGPGMGGVELAKAVREQYPSTPIVLHTAGDEQDAGQKSGVPCYTKDFKNLSKILEHLRK